MARGGGNLVLDLQSSVVGPDRDCYGESDDGCKVLLRAERCAIHADLLRSSRSPRDGKRQIVDAK